MKQTLEGISNSQCQVSGEEYFTPKSNFGWPFRLLAFLIAFAVFFQGPVLVAASITWDPFNLYSSGSLGGSSGTLYSGTFSTLTNGHWLATGGSGSTVVPGTSDIVILNLGSASYSITLSTGTIASIAGGTVSAGTGLAGSTISFAGSGTLAIGGTGITVNAGTLFLGGSVLVSLLSSQTWSVSAGSQMTVAGTITGTGFDLTKSGVGVLTLSGSGGYTGSTFITAGILNAGTGSLANTGTIILSGGSLSAVNVKNNALFTGSAGTTASFSSTALALSTVAEYGTLTFSGTSGTVVLGSLSGTGSTTFASSAIIQGGSITAGTVSVASNLTSNISGGVVTVTGSSSVANVGTLSGGSVTLAGRLSGTTISGGTVTVAGLTTEALLSGGSLIANGGGVLTTMTGGTLILGIGGTLTLGTLSSNSAADRVTDNGSLTVSAGLLKGQLSGTGSFTKIGAGTLTLDNASNTFAGTLNVAGGTLSASFGTTLQFVSVVNVTAGSLIAISLPVTALLNVGTGASASFSVSSLTLGTLSSYGSISASGNTISIGSFNSYGSTYFSGSTTAVTIGSLIGAGSIGSNGSGSFTVSSGAITQATLNLPNSSLTANVSGGSVSAKSLLAPSQTISGGSISLTGSGISTLGTLNGGTITLLVPGATLQVSSGNYSDIGGIRGLGALSKTGSGSLVLGSVNTYSGATSISGTLQATVAGALGATSSITVNSGSTLSAKDVGSATPSLSIGAAAFATISGTNGISLQGVSNSGSLTFSGSSGTVSLGFLSGVPGVTNFLSAATVSGSINSGTVNVVGALSGNVVAGGSVTVGGLFTGGTVTGGSLGLASDGSITTLNGGTIQGTGVGVGSLSVSQSTGTSTAVLGGSLALFKIGAGTLTLGGTSTYTGNTTLSFGILSLNNPSAIGTGTLVIAGGSLDNTSGGSVTLNNNAQNWLSDISFIGSNALNLGSGSVTVTADRIVTVNASTLTLGGSIFAAGATLTKAGSGALVLSGTNAIRGVSLTGGSLLLQSQNALSGGSLAITGGTLDLGGYTQSISSGSFVTGKVVNGTLSSSSVVTLLGVDLGVRLNGTGSLLKQGSSTVTLTGVGNDFSGGTNLSAGTLILNTDAALGTGTLNLSGGSLGVSTAGLVTLSNNIQTWASDFSFFGPGTLALGNGAVTLTANRTVNVASGSLSVGGVIGDPSGRFNLMKSGTGTLVLGADNTFVGGFTMNEGAVNTGTAGALGAGNVTVTGGSLNLQNTVQDIAGVLSVSGGVVNGGTINLSGAGLALTGGNISADIGGVGGFMSSGTGYLAVLAGNNTFGGDATLTAGTLALNNPNALSLSQLTISGGSLDNTSGAAVNILNNRPQTWAGSFGFVGSNNLAFPEQSITLLKDITLTVSAGKLTEGGAISGTYNLTKDGNGILEFTGSSPGYSGALSVLAGTLLLSAPNTLPGIRSLSMSAGSIDLGGGSQSFSALSLQAGYVGHGTLTASGTIFLKNSGELAATLKGGASLLKSGSGTATLSQANFYTGGTNVSGGTLFLGDNSAVGTGSLTLSGGSLGVTVGSLIALAGVDQKYWSSNFSFFGGTLNSGTGEVSMTQSVTITVNSGSLIEGGVISGTSAVFGLTKTGGGTLQLNGLNTYTGATTINGGLLFVPTLSGGSTSSLSIGTAGSVLFADSGMSITTPYVNNGSLNFSATGGTITLGSLTGNGTTTFGSDAIITSGISGGNVIVTDSLTASISSGTVSAQVLTAASMSGGSLTLTDNTQNSTITLLSGGGFLTDNGSLTIGSGIYSGIVSGSGILSKINQGSKLTLSGANTFSGSLFLLGGTLEAQRFGSTASLFVQPAATANINGSSPSLGVVFNDGSLTFSNSTGTATLASLGSLSSGGITTFASNATISSGGFLAGILNVAGNLVLQGTMSGGTVSAGAIPDGFSHSTTISGGSLNVSGRIDLLQISGGMLTQTGNDKKDVSLGSMTGGTLITKGNLGPAGTLKLTVSGGSILVGEVAILGTVTAGTIRVNGAADIFRFDGGNLDIHGATLIQTLNGGSIVLNAPLTVKTGVYSGTNGIISGTGNLIHNIGALIGGAAELANMSSNVQYLTNNGSLLSGVVIGTNFDFLNSNINKPSLPIANGTTAASVIVSGTGVLISGTRASQNDTGYVLSRAAILLSLAGANTYTGATLVHNGYMIVAAGAIENSTSITVNGGHGVGTSPSYFTTMGGTSITVVSGTSSVLAVGTIRTDYYSATMGGSLTAVDVNRNGSASLTVGTYGVATFSAKDLKFANVQNDAPAFYQMDTGRSDGAVLLAETGLYFPNVDSQGTITIGNLTGAGYTYVASNFNGVISLNNPIDRASSYNTGLIVKGTTYADISTGRISTGAINNRNISGGIIDVNGSVVMSGTFSGGDMSVLGTTMINSVDLSNGGILRLDGQTTINRYLGENKNDHYLTVNADATIGFVSGGFNLTGVLTVSSGSLYSLNPNNTNLAVYSGGIVKVGTYTTLILDGTNNFGSTTLSQGTLNLASATGLGRSTFSLNSGVSLGNVSNGPLVFANLQQSWNGDFTFAGPDSISFSGGSVNLISSSTLTVTAGSFTEGADIAGGTFALGKKGNGTLVLGGVGNFSGGFTLSGGTVNATVNSAVGSGTLTVDSSSTLNLGSTIQSLSGFVLGGSLSSGIVFGGTIAADAFTLWSGIITSNLIDGPSGYLGQGASLTKSGTATVVLQGTIGYTGPTTITGGGLDVIRPDVVLAGVANDGLLRFTAVSGTTSLVSLSGNGTTRFLSNAQIGDLTGGTISTAGTLFVTGGAFTGSLVDSSSLEPSSLEKTGASDTRLVLSGSNTYTGSTKVSGGTLSSTIAGALSSTTSLSVTGGLLDVVDYNPNITLSVGASGSALIIGTGLVLPGGAFNEGNLSFTASSGTLTLGSLSGGGVTSFLSNAKISGGSITDGVVSVAGTLFANVAGGVVTTGVLQLRDNTLYGGNVTLNSGSSTIATFQGGASLSVGSSATLIANNGTINGISGLGTVIKAGAADTLNLSDSTLFGGSYWVSAGTLNVVGLGLGANLRVDTYGIANVIGSEVTLGSLSGSGTTDFSGDVSLTSLAGLSEGNVFVSGTLTLAGAFKGGNLSANQLVATSIEGGSIILTGTGVSQIGLITAGTLTNNATLQINSGTITNEIGGHGILLKVGTDTLLTIQQGKLPQIGGVSVLEGTLNAVDFGTLTATNLVVGTFGTGVISGTGISLGNVTADGSLVFSGGTVSLTNLGGVGTTTFANEAAISGTLSGGNVTVGGTFSAGILSGGVNLTLNGLTATVGLLNGGLLTSDSLLVVTGSGGAAIAAGVGGTELRGLMSLEKRGNGAVSLAAANTYFGGTTLLEGTLNLNNAGALGLGVGGLIIAGGAMDNTSGGPVTLVGHSETWSGDFSFLGTNNSKLSLGTGQVTMTGPIVLSVNAGTLEVGGPIAGGSAGFTKAGDGVLQLSGSVSFSGGTKVNGGVLVLVGSSALAGADLIVSAGSVDLSGNSQAVGNVIAEGGYIGNGSLLSSGFVSLGSGTIAAVISGTGAVTKSGPGSASLSISNWYSGGTIVNEGTLNINDSHAIGTGTLLLNGGGVGTTLPSGTILSSNNPQVWAGSFTFSGTNLDMGTGAVTMTVSPTISVNSGSLFERGAISDGALGLSLTKAGDGTLVLSGSNSYTGGTNVSGGVLLLEGGDVTLNGSLTVSVGTLNLDGRVHLLGDVSLLNGGAIQNGTIQSSGSLSIYNGGVIAAIIAGNTTQVRTLGSGTVSLSTDNTYGGGTYIEGGTLDIAGGKAIGTGSLYMKGGDLASFSGGSLFYNNAQVWDSNFNFSGTLNTGTGAVTVTGNRNVGVLSGTLSIGGSISGGASSLTKSGNGTLLLEGTSTFGGGLTISDGILALGSAAKLTTVSSLAASGGVFDLGAGSYTFSQISLTGGTIANGTLRLSAGSYAFQSGSVSAVLQGTSSLVKSGSGSLTLTGLNRYSGATSVVGGTLFAGTGALAYSSAINVTSGSLEAANYNLSALLTVGSAGIASVSNTNLSVGSINSNGVVNFRGDTGSITVGTLSGTGTTNFFSDGTLNSVIQAGKVVVAGTLKANANITGGSVKAGVLISPTVSGGFIETGTAGVSQVTNLNGGTFVLGGTLEVNSGTYAGGGLSGGGSLRKTGSGTTLVLNAPSTYSGATTVTAGTLLVMNSGTFAAVQNEGAVEFRATTTLASLSGAGTTTFSGTAISATIGALNGNFINFINSNNGNAVLNVSSGSYDSGLISGSIALVKIGNGALTLGTAGAYTGGTTLSAGTLNLKNPNALGTGSLIISSGVLDNTSAGSLALSVSSITAGSFGFIGSNALTLSAPITLSSNVLWTVDASTLSLTGNITGGSYSLSKAGSGRLLLSGSNAFSGGVFVNNGTLAITKLEAIGTGALTTYAGSVLELVGGGLFQFSSLTLGGSVIGTGTIYVSGPITAASGNQGAQYAGPASFSKSDSSETVLDKVNYNTGGYLVSAGTLTLNNSSAASTGALTLSGGSIDTTADGIVLAVSSQVWSGSFAFKGSKNLNTGTGAVTLTQNIALNTVAGILTVAGIVSGGTNGLTKTGLGTLRLAGSTFSGTTAVSAGTLEYGANGMVSGNVVVSAGATTKLDGNFSAGVVNVGSLGAMTLGGGTLSVGTFSFGSSKSQSGGTLIASGTTTSFVGTLKGSGSISGPGIVVFGAGSTLDVGYSPGVLVVSGGATMMIASSGVTVKYEYDPTLPTQDYGNITATGTLASDRIVVQSGGSLTFQNGATMTLTPTYISGKVPAAGVYYDFPLVIVNGGTINALDINGATAAVSGTNLDDYFKVGSSTVVSGTFRQLAGGTVDVTLVRKSYAAVTASAGNLRQTASILDSIMLSGGTAAIAAIGPLFSSLDAKATAIEFDTLLAVLNPAPYTELGNIGMNRMMDLQAAIQGHLDTLAIGVLSDMEPSAGEARESTAWTSVYSGWATRDGSTSQGLTGYSSRNFGSISGVEHRFGDLTLGITGAVGSTSATFTQTSSSLTSDTWHAGLYGSVPIDLEDFGVVFDAGLVYGQGESTLKRSLAGAGLGLGAFTGKSSSTEWMAQFGASFPSVLPDDTYTVTPSVHLLYGSYSQGATNEITDGTLAALAAKVGAFSQASVATRLGLQGAKLLRVGKMPARLTASMNWLHSFDSAGRQVDISFATPGATAQKFGSSRTGMDAIRIGLGSEMAITDRTRFLLTIDHQMQKGQSTTTGNASIGVQF